MNAEAPAPSNALLLKYGHLEEDKRKIEADIREYIAGLFFVLEKRRRDTSYEKSEGVEHPKLPIEQKYTVGLEKRASK